MIVIEFNNINTFSLIAIASWFFYRLFYSPRQNTVRKKGYNIERRTGRKKKTARKTKIRENVSNWSLCNVDLLLVSPLALAKHTVTRLTCCIFGVSLFSSLLHLLRRVFNFSTIRLYFVLILILFDKVYIKYCPKIEDRIYNAVELVSLQRLTIARIARILDTFIYDLKWNQYENGKCDLK